MGYSYGIKVCRETLLYLASDQSLEERLVHAHSEMNVVTSEDVSKHHFREIKEWEVKYFSIRDFAVNSSGELVEIDKIKEYRDLIVSLIWLCVEIIEHNSRNSKKSY